MEKWLVLLFLFINTWTDMKKREISLLSVVLIGVYGFFTFWAGKNLLQIQVIPIIIGCFFLALSVVSKGKIGIGDSLILIGTAMYESLPLYLFMIFGALFLASFWGIGLMIFQKREKDTPLPFVPFLLLSYIGGMVLCI